VSRRIPLFPLPGVVLFPGTLLPLHIFEPRYRAMVADALAGDRTIGMAMLKGDREAVSESPGIYSIGGAGEIVESDRLPDGRYNILLEGRFRYRVLAEERTKTLYRTARVEEIASIPFPDPEEETRVCREAGALFDRLRESLELPPLPEGDLPSERLSSEMALRLRYAPAELQALLEIDSLAARFQSLIGRMAEWDQRLRFLAPFRPADLDVTKN